MTVELKTTYAGVTLKNPLVIGGGPNTATPKICEKAARAGWGGVVLKLNAADDMFEHIFPDPSTVYKVPRPAYKLVDASGIHRWRPKIPRVAGKREPGKIAGKVEPKDYQLVYWSQNITKPKYLMYSAIGTFYNGDKYPWYIDKAKELCQPYDCKVFANVTAYTEKGWEQQLRIVNNSRADGVEVVIACPGYGVFDEKSQRVRTFHHLDTFAEIIGKTTKFYVDRSDKPVSVKLPPVHVNFMAPIEAAVSAGAQAIQFGDCPTLGAPFPPIIIDPDTGEVGLFPGAPYQGAMTQCMVVPYICGAMARARLAGIKVDLAGCGGVRDYEDVLRILMSGATSVQVATAVLVEGVVIATEYLESIEKWMTKKDYSSIHDFMGTICTPEKLTIQPEKFVAEVALASGGPTPSLKTVVNRKRCINCGWCETSCPEMAIEIPDNVPVIDAETCEVCGLCVAICPMDALSIVPKSD